MRSTFLYALNDGTARRNLGWASLTFDPAASELLVVANGVVDFFNDNGIPTYSFTQEPAYGAARAAVALPEGDILLLDSGAEGAWSLVRCNFRGEPLRAIEIAGLPKEFAEGFQPGTLAFSGGKVYLADTSSMKAAAITPAGATLATYDLAEMIGLGSVSRSDAMMRGFSVDRSGNLLFTVASVFAAYVVTPEGKVRGFGGKGSSPGKFNVVSGIAADEDGRLFLTDALRAVVMVFDVNLRFLGEFGYRGEDPENLIGPFNLVVGNGRVYVTQSRGAVKAFAVQFD